MTSNSVNYDQLLLSRAYDPENIPPKEQILLKIEEKTIGSIQNIVTVSGLPKQGKSRYIGAMAASAISGDPVFDIQVNLPEGRKEIGYFDTEQGTYDFYKTVNFIKQLAGDSLENFFSFNTREDYPNTQLKLIQTFLDLRPNCSLLFLDGILDLLDSFNDERESIKLMRLLKKWSKERNILIILVLHRKKDGSSTLGHIGSAIDRASQSILTVEKNKERNTYILKPEFLRSADDFTPIEIFYNKNIQQWQQTFTVPGDESDKKLLRMKKLRPAELVIDEHRQNVRRIFAVNCPQTYDELLQNVREFYQAGKNWAEECIRFLYGESMIYKTKEGYTNIQKQSLFVEK